MPDVLTPRRLADYGDALVPTHMAHFVLYSARKDEMVQWYKTVLNARVVVDLEGLCFLTFDREHHRLVIRQVDGLRQPDPKAWGVAHVAYSYGSLGELLATFVRLRKAGILPNRCINHGPTTSFYYFDPDGTNIELQADNFDSVEDTHAFMTGEEFLRNASGVLFDPDELIAAYERGVPEADLKRRPPSAPLARVVTQRQLS